MIWHKKLGILLLFALCICMSGCGRNEKKSVTISMIHAWGGTEEDHAAMRDIYEEFQKENPDIILQTIPMLDGERSLSKSGRSDHGRRCAGYH